MNPKSPPCISFRQDGAMGIHWIWKFYSAPSPSLSSLSASKGSVSFWWECALRWLTAYGLPRQSVRGWVDRLDGDLNSVDWAVNPQYKQIVYEGARVVRRLFDSKLLPGTAYWIIGDPDLTLHLAAPDLSLNYLPTVGANRLLDTIPFWYATIFYMYIYI